MLNRFVMCGLIWLPSPKMNRPCENDCKSQPIFANVIGLRANATAMEVPISRCDVCSAARSSGKNGSCEVSAVQPPEYPAVSKACAEAAAEVRLLEIPPSSFILIVGAGGVIACRRCSKRIPSLVTSCNAPSHFRYFEQFQGVVAKIVRELFLFQLRRYGFLVQ